MKNKLVLIYALLPICLFGQITVNNAEDFTVGTVLVFQHCEAENVSEGKTGENQTWNFSKLKLKKGETTTERMVSPQSTKKWNLFPNSNLVEEYSDGRNVYVSKTETENLLMGYVDTTNDMILKYEDPMLFAKRPFKYGDTITDVFTTEFSVKGMDFKGSGNVTITADGYGKLILPNGKYDNVLRVKIVQHQADTLVQYSSVNTTESITYVWFDNVHTSSLLKINEVKSTYYNDRSIEYLLSETH